MKIKVDISYEEMIKRAKRLISPRVGVIKGIYPAFTQHFDPHTFSFGTEKTDTSKFFLHKAPERGGAAGADWESAYIASVGEAIERYCCALYDTNSLIFTSYSKLSKGALAVHPSNFALFSEKQYKRRNFPYKPFTESSNISWVRAFSAIKQKDIYIPAQTIFLPFTRQKNEIPLCPITSTGLAAGPSLEFAVLTALYEIIERDAFTIMWLTKLPPLKINIEHFPETYHFFKSRFDYNNFDYTFYDITLDINIPTAMIILRGTIDIGEITGVGCGTRATLEGSLQKALLEISQLPPWIRYAYQKEPNWTCKDDFSDINSFDDHGQLYTRRKDLTKKAFSFLNKARIYDKYQGVKQTKNTTKRLLNQCLDELGKYGFNVITYDLTTCDILDAGFRVVRVVVPGLIPLHGDHRYPFLGGSRIYDIPLKLRLRKSFDENMINQYPHPSA